MINKINDSTKNNKKIKKEESVNISVTDDKMINAVLENIGKKKKNIKTKNVVDNFISNKSNNTKNNKNIENDKNNIFSNEDKDEDEDENKNDNENIKKKTFTENLTKEEINKKLEDYKLVDDISKIPLDTHLRYFIKKDNQMLFRMGGNLKRNLDLPKFIVLKNAIGTEWTVQIKDTIFYKKMSIIEIKEEYEIIITELHEKIKNLKKQLKTIKEK